MIIPVRCFTCGKVSVFITKMINFLSKIQVVGNKFTKFIDLQETIETDVAATGISPQAEGAPHKNVAALALDELGLTRYCCRRMILTHVDLITKLLNYNIYEFQE